ncbi:ATP-grasp ribosomal peptide maturase [Thermopolyspora sp. NPDC052614]|uniref:ATP-grasp ribosomal peptide maturase n=1 Tax=Thermopolyspora sp. NPDC052614 TaxID=3155682 RepID=UPI0034223BEF
MLILTCLDDPTSDVVISELCRRGIAVVRLDPGEFLAGRVELAARFGPGALSGRIRTPTRLLDLERVRSVYYRRPSPHVAPAGMDAQDGRFALAQARYGLDGVLGDLSCRYVNHPWNIMRADFKPAQLNAAVKLGFQVPPTIVTNSLDEARRFAAGHGPVVYKPLRTTPFTVNGDQPAMVWVDVVDPVELDERIALTAHMFQARTPGKIADVRVTVIGEEVFAVRIDSPCLDFRRDYERVTYSKFDLPSSVADACRAYLSHFGLLFGAFDFGLRADLTLDWYECNPAGQWHWLEEETGLPMTSALADLLEAA